MEKRVPYPQFTPADLRKIEAWMSALDPKERERLRFAAINSQRYLRHEAAVKMGVCK